MRLSTSLLRKALLSSACGALALSPSARAAGPRAPIMLGMGDPVAFQGDLTHPQEMLAIEHARAAGATIIRLGVSWRDIAPTQPMSTPLARSPSWSGYRWGETDREVRAVVAAGMKPLLVVADAPEWAEGAQRPPDAVPGTWQPNPSAYGDFAVAIARRYGGSASDESGARLPRVRYFQAWNEPNISIFLEPQWVGSGGGGARTQMLLSPAIYRSLLNAFYASVKSVHQDDVVLSAGLAPFGDYPVGSGGRTPPVYFTRALVCVSEAGPPRARRCPRVSFDAFAANLYPGPQPFRPPFNAYDIRLRLDKLSSALRLAAGAGTVGRRQANRIWVTELGWETAPAGDRQVSLADQAGFLETAVYVFWHEGVQAVLWYNIRDRASGGGPATSGLFMRGSDVANDTPKPAYTAFRFPFLAFRSGPAGTAWGRAPAASRPVTIERADGGGGWKPLLTTSASSSHIFLVAVHVAPGVMLRAHQGADVSLPWAVSAGPPVVG